MGSDDYFDVEVVNDSDQPVKISVIDALYGNRLRLLREGTLVPLSRSGKLFIKVRSRLAELGDLVSPEDTSGVAD